MAGGLVGLLDDVAALARLAATSIDDVGAAAGRATTRAAGVLIDDAAVTPQYVQGLAADRELPIILRIAKGSFRNKLLFVVPAALLLSQFLPVLLTPILMLGGGYLCYEGAHKVWGLLRGEAHDGHTEDEPVTEDELVAGAIRTDLILSAEVMVIALDEVASEGLLSRAVILVVVAIAITVLVYGVVALIVKMDDVGLRLAQGDGASADLGTRLVRAMPRLLALLSTVGTAAMLWVGGHIELVGLEEFGVTAPYDLVHDLEEVVREATGALGGVLAWSANTAASALLGIVLGAALVAARQVVDRRGTRVGH
jgi:hypothetical protein